MSFKSPSAGSLFGDQPVLTVAYVSGVLVSAVTALSAHGVFNGTVASSIDKNVIPYVAGALVVLAGHFAKRWVSPVSKLVATAEKDLGITPAEFEFLKQMVYGPTKPSAFPASATPDPALPAVPTDLPRLPEPANAASSAPVGLPPLPEVPAPAQDAPAATPLVQGTQAPVQTPPAVPSP
ncbi:MAG: hypothetical protein M3O41_09345 [Pseudomonadota bacterium]|nr:hypothetical protein [Pseudomonadota bacterium]